MSQKTRTYYCIDMKSFYASVECAERGLNPFETNLVVADPNRGRNALCLAITPRMKAQGIKNRCRLSDIPASVKYEIAMPRMQLYIEYAADIYAIYLDYFDAQDIHVYSIDESFIDATYYLDTYKTDTRALAKLLMNEIASKLHVPSTAGIGTNLYLAKVALDISAKRTKDHLGYLTEELYRETLWDHQPLTDFWQIGKGIARRLERYGLCTMRRVAQAPKELLYKTFGINAELLIDHAWGRESCLISDIKSYRPKSKSVSFSQILPRDYSYDEARTVMLEMVTHGCQELMRRKVIAKKIWIGIGYSREEHPSTHGTTRMANATSVISLVRPYVISLFDNIALKDCKIRRLGINFTDVCDEGCEGYDMFTDWNMIERESSVQTSLSIMAGTIEANFYETTSGISEMNGEVSQQFESIRSFIRLISSGIVLGESGSSIKLKLENDILYFFTGDEDTVSTGNALAYFSSGKLYVNDVQVLTSLRIGPFAWVPESNNLNFKLMEA